METTDALDALVQSALKLPQAREAIADATSYLITLLEKNSFNSKRATEVYVIAIDNAVWLSIKKLTMRDSLYRDYKTSGLGKAYGQALTDTFTKDGAIPDQRPARQNFRWLLGS